MNLWLKKGINSVILAQESYMDNTKKRKNVMEKAKTAMFLFFSYENNCLHCVKISFKVLMT